MEAAVIDASLVVDLLSAPALADHVAATIGEPDLRAPDLINLEVLAGLRGLVLRGELPRRRAEASVRALASSPIDRVPTGELMETAWRLRDNVSVYDASYVALARADDCPLLTADGRLARAPGLGVEVVLFTRESP